VKTYLFILLLLVTSTFSQNARFESLIKTGIDQIYGIEFQKAEQTFRTVQKEFPHNPAGKFFEAMIDWWRIMLDMESEEFDDQFEDKLDAVIDMCDDILDDDEKNIDALFFKGGAFGFRGRLYSIRESWMDAALDGKDAMPLVYQVYEADPDNRDIQLGFGIYNYYASVIPEKYPFIKPFMMFFPQGDKDKGLKQLETVALNGRYTKIEARYFLLTSYYAFEENMDKAMQWADSLSADFPNNPTFERYKGRILVKKGSYTNASPIFESILTKCDLGLPGYLDRTKRESAYYIGMRHKIQNHSDSAKVYFEICEKLSRNLDDDEPSGWLVNSVLYLGMLNDKLGQRQKAIKYYKEVLEFDERQDSHEKARRYLEKPYK